MINLYCAQSKVRICQVSLEDLSLDVFLGDHPKSADDFFSLFELKIRSAPPEYENVSNLLGISKEKKIYVVPKNKLVDHRLKIERSLTKIFSDKSNVKYFSNYVKCKQFLSSLQPAKIDSGVLKSIIDQQQHDGVKSNLSTFFPANEETTPIKYSMSSSATGRLSVTQGPRVLTSPSIFKRSLRSRYPNGKVIQLDLKSAEPNFALFALDKPTSDTIYSDISNEVLSDAVDRDTAKLITLSALYGQSITNLRKQLPPTVGAEGVLRKVKQYFSYKEFLSKLNSMYNTGDFRNFVGRPLKTDKKRLLVSHFLQSSVAEACMLMFSDFCAKNTDCIPLFVIHDALIIDCKESFANYVLSNEMHLEFMTSKFPVSVCEVG